MARTSRKVWAERIKQWKSSGVSGSEYAAQIGVKESTLRHWRWLLGRRERPAFVEIATAVTVPDGEAFELILGDGRRLRIPSSFEESSLQRLLAVLGGR